MLRDYYRWSLCLVAVVFGQQQQEENSDKEILRRHGDYFLRCSYCNLRSTVCAFLMTNVLIWIYILKTQARQWGWQACAGRGRHSEAAWAVQVGRVQVVLPSLLLKALQENCSPNKLIKKGAPRELLIQNSTRTISKRPASSTICRSTFNRQTISCEWKGSKKYYLFSRMLSTWTPWMTTCCPHRVRYLLAYCYISLF